MGYFDKYTVDEIREIVEHDRPDALHRQAAAWTAMSDLLGENADEIDADTTALRKSWSGDAAAGFAQELTTARTAMRDAAEIAARNAHGWAGIADIVAWAQHEVLQVHDVWLTARDAASESGDARYVPADVEVVVGDRQDVDQQRGPFDQAAQTVMNSAAEAIDELYHEYLAVPGGYDPPPAVPVPWVPPAGGAAGTAPDSADNDDDVFFSEEGPHSGPLLQGSHASMPGAGGMGPGGGGISAGGGSPAMTPTPVSAVGGRFGNVAAADSIDWDDRGNRFSRAPKTYTGDSISTNKIENVQAPRPESIDSEVERLSRREPDGDCDEVWNIRKDTVPGVITTNDTQDPHHDPGPVTGGRS